MNSKVLVIVCLIGGKYAIDGVITIGTFQVFISYATQFIKPFNELSNVSGELANCLASIDRILEAKDAKDWKQGRSVPPSKRQKEAFPSRAQAHAP